MAWMRDQGVNQGVRHLQALVATSSSREILVKSVRHSQALDLEDH